MRSHNCLRFHPSMMNEIALIISFILIVIDISSALSGSIKKNNFRKVDSTICDQATAHGGSFGDVLSLSRLACARLCFEGEHCHFFKAKSETTGHSPTLCQVFSLVDKNGSQPLPDQSLKASLDPTLYFCYRQDDWFPSRYYDNSHDLESNNWVANRDTDDPETETWRKDEFDKNDQEAKIVFRDDDDGIVYSVAINFLRPSSNKASGSSPYTIERDHHGYFKERDASRVFFSFFNSGLVYTSFVHPNGSSWMTSKSLSRLQVFVRRPNEYSTYVQGSGGTIPTVINNFEKGYKAEKVKYALTSDTEQTVVMYSFEENVLMQRASGQTKLPLSYFTFMEKFHDDRVKYRQRFGLMSELDIFLQESRDKITMSPLWRSTGDISWNASQNFNSLVISMAQGHAFRVTFDGGFFDVEAVIQMTDDIYFVLPQLVHNPQNEYLDQAMLAQRAIVSSGGFYSFCSYRLESEDVLDSGVKVVSHVQHFVDRKVRVPTLAVFSNGTVIFGSARRVAEGTKAGQEVTILIEWMTTDVAILVGVVMVTVKYDATPDVLVSAESRVSWDVRVNSEGKLTVSEKCDMRKVLTMSNGQVDILSYNVYSRRSVVRLPDAKTTWFLS